MGNNDRQITQSDFIFTSLRLWQDTNHDGISAPSELHTLSELGLNVIELDYKESKQIDQHGNQFRYSAKVKDINGAQISRWAAVDYRQRVKGEGHTSIRHRKATRKPTP